MMVSKRRTVWTPLSTSGAMGASSSATLNLLVQLPLDLESIGGLTVVRIIGEFHYRCDVVGTFQTFQAAIGVFHEAVVASDFALATSNYSLMWTLFSRTTGQFLEVAAGDFDAIEEVRPVNVRVNRKMNSNEQLMMVIVNGTGQTLEFFLGCRVLVMLP